MFKVIECSMVKTKIGWISGHYSYCLKFIQVFSAKTTQLRLQAAQIMLEFFSLSNDFVHLSNIVLLVASCLGYSRSLLRTASSNLRERDIFWNRFLVMLSLKHRLNSATSTLQLLHCFISWLVRNITPCFTIDGAVFLTYPLQFLIEYWFSHNQLETC